MKITNIGNFVGYKKEVAKLTKTEKVQSKNYDMIQISKNQSMEKPSTADNIDNVKNKLVNDLNAENDAAKIENIRAQISANTYVVDSKELARILMSI